MYHYPNYCIVALGLLVTSCSCIYLIAGGWLRWCSIDWVLDFLFFYLFRSFITKSIEVLMLWWVSLGVHFCLFFISKGRFSWSVFDFGLISLKWPRSLIRQKKFSASLSNCLLLYFFGVGTKLRSLKVSKENEFFDKFLTCPDGSDLYLILLLIARCMPIAFPLFVG